MEKQKSTAASSPLKPIVSGDAADRLAFEKWASDDYKNPNAIERNGEGYKLMQTQSDWSAWKACSQSIGVVWHQYPDVTPMCIGSYLVEKRADGISEIEWAFYNSNGQWCSTTGYLIDGIVSRFTKLPRLPAR